MRIIIHLEGKKDSFFKPKIMGMRKLYFLFKFIVQNIVFHFFFYKKKENVFSIYMFTSGTILSVYFLYMRGLDDTHGRWLIYFVFVEGWG